MFRAAWCFCAVSLVAIAASADDQTEWIGQKVFWKDGAKPKVGNQEIDPKLIPFPTVVTSVNGEWLWVGRAWIRKTDVMSVDQALTYYSEFIRKDPTSSFGWGNRGAVRFEKGDVDNALKDYTEAIRLDPKNAMALNNRGNAWVTKGDVDNAIKDYTEAVRLDPKYAKAFNNRGFAWKAKGDVDQAIKDYTEAIRLDPKEADAFNNRANAWNAKGNRDQAIEDYTEAVRLDPKFATAFANRGFAWQMKHDFDRAIKDYTEAIRLDPENPDGYNGLAWLLATCSDAKFRNGKQAVEYARKACELEEWNDINQLDTLAAAYAESGDFDQAIEWQTKAMGMLKDDKAKQEFRSRIELYKSGKPYHELPQK